jgi:reactive intermediate/imine deaminase
MRLIEPAILAFCISIFTAGAMAAGSGPEAAQLIALQNVTVIDGLGSEPRAKQTILIEGERIKAVFPAGKKRLGKNTVLVDLTGKYVLPGLIDSHVHLATDPENGDDVGSAVVNLGHYLRGGVTAVRDMGGDARVLAYLARQTLIDAIDGPDIFYSTIIGGPEFFSDPRTLASAKGFEPGAAPWMRAVSEETDLPRVLAQARGAGSTGIKIYRFLPAELVASLAREAEQQGLVSWAHLDVNPATPQAIAEAAVTSVSHAAYFLGRNREEQKRWKEGRAYNSSQVEDSEVALLLKTLADNKVILDATLVIFDRKASATTDPYYASADRAGVDLTRRAYQAGVKIAAGTDQAISPVNTLPPVHDELVLLVERAGLSPVDAIKAATSHGAELLGKSGEFGAISEGLKANLLVLNSDPSRNIRNTRDINHVIKNGRMIYRGLEGLNLPFSDARELDGQLWLSGQIGNLPGTLSLVKGGIEAETAQALRNIDSVLQMHGLTRKHVRKCTVMLADIEEWGLANAVYKRYFNTGPMPARSAFASAGLALEARIELECVAQR